MYGCEPALYATGTHNNAIPILRAGIVFNKRIKKPAKPLQDFAGNLCRLLKLFRHPAMQRQKNSFTLKSK